MTDLSIIIPVWNERRKIGRDVEAAAVFFRSRKIKGELIVSDDGSRDGTAEAAEAAGKAHRVPLKVLRLPHRGKGHAVRRGMLASSGRVAGFLDSGLCVPYEDIWTGIRWIQSGRCDIAHGSRRHAESVIVRPGNRTRRFASDCFRRVASGLFRVPDGLTDTQVGCKFYRGETGRGLYAACGSDGFLFDLEVLVLARKAGCRVMEFPVHWTSDPDSRLFLIRSLPGIAAEALALLRSGQPLGRNRVARYPHAGDGPG
ncbi:MAG: glycosyltransferase [bacterium]|nr:glycosyltransferase [bacterium]